MTADPTEPEPQTGPLEGRCGAIRKRDAEGNPIRWCRKYPMRGQTRCERDGGKAPQNLAAAARRREEEQARAVIARYGVPVHIDWHQAMQESLDETYGCVLALRNLVQQLAPEALVWGITSEVEVGSSQFPGVDITKAAAIAPTVKLYGEERDRLFRMAADCGKLGLEVRRQALAEQDGAAVADAIKDILSHFGINPNAPDVQQFVANRLLAITGVRLD